jgi:hypothetical protein
MGRFLEVVKGLVDQENVVWNPATKRLQPWIDTQVSGVVGGSA